VTNLTQAKAQRDYARRLTFDARGRFIREQLYAHVRYLAQLLPAPTRTNTTSIDDKLTLSTGGGNLPAPAVDLIPAETGGSLDPR
jgi:hypothetical protein